MPNDLLAEAQEYFGPPVKSFLQEHPMTINAFLSLMQKVYRDQATQLVTEYTNVISILAPIE